MEIRFGNILLSVRISVNSIRQAATSRQVPAGLGVGAVPWLSSHPQRRVALPVRLPVFGHLADRRRWRAHGRGVPPLWAPRRRGDQRLPYWPREQKPQGQPLSLSGLARTTRRAAPLPQALPSCHCRGQRSPGGRALGSVVSGELLTIPLERGIQRGSTPLAGVMRSLHGERRCPPDSVPLFLLPSWTGRGGKGGWSKASASLS